MEMYVCVCVCVCSSCYLSICLLQIMQETLSFFMFLLQLKDKIEDTKQVQ